MFKAHIKLTVLEELNKKSSYGYDVMKSIGELGKKPSPGYIYPLLNDLEKKNFISVKKDGRRKIYSITPDGRKFLKNLKNKRKLMFEKMIQMWEPIAGKEEIEHLKKFKINRDKSSLPLRDLVLIKKLHRLIFSSYQKRNDENRKKIKKILEETIVKIEKINQK